jgi:hypothetical protein
MYFVYFYGGYALRATGVQASSTSAQQQLPLYAVIGAHESLRSSNGSSCSTGGVRDASARHRRDGLCRPARRCISALGFIGSLAICIAGGAAD